MEDGENGNMSLAAYGGNNEDVHLTTCGGAVADVTWMWVELVPVSIWIKTTHVNDGNGGRVNLVVDGDVGQWEWR